MLSREVEAVLRLRRARRFLRAALRRRAARWDDALAGYDRLRAIVNACTRLRFCTADDTMEFREKRGPGTRPAGYRRGSRSPSAVAAAQRVVCGHWSTLDLMLRAERADARLGLRVGRARSPRSGWTTGACYQVPSRSPIAPKPFG